jgi:hypothetical protein
MGMGVKKVGEEADFYWLGWESGGERGRNEEKSGYTYYLPIPGSDPTPCPF